MNGAIYPGSEGGAFMDGSIGRRDFIRGAAVAGAMIATRGLGEGSGSSARRIKLGMDNFAVRAMGWKAPALIDYAASLKLDTILLSDLEVYESLDDAYLKSVREHARKAGVEIHAGTGSICPTSNSFNTKYGSAEEHLSLAIRVAKAVGSPVVRCVLGNGGDRMTDGGIEKRIEDTVKVCKSARNLAIDSGVKIAVENHAGDMQAWELVQLIEAAGKDYVGANLDSGNAVWTLEDPLESLETLGPYAATTSLRDSAVWECEEGAMVAWTAIGDGQVDFKAYVARFGELCPGVPFQIETISGAPRKMEYLKPEFWKPYPKARAASFARFVAMAKRGKPIEQRPRPAAASPKEQDQLAQKAELERSVRYCRETLGLGVAGR